MAQRSRASFQLQPVRRRLCFGALAIVIVLVTSACRVQTQVAIKVDENGSGSVTVRITLDADAARRVPDLAQELKTADLAAAGWTIDGPTKQSGDAMVIEATKHFADPAGASEVLNEISGSQGPFRDFAITRSRSFARTKFSFRGTVDFSAGLASFSDSELAAQLDGKPLGDDVQAIEARLGEPLAAVFQFRVSVQLPGVMQSNAPAEASNVAVWQPRLEGGTTLLVASSTSTRWPTLVATVVAVLAAVVLVVIVVLKVRSARRRNRQPRHAA